MNLTHLTLACVLALGVLFTQGKSIPAASPQEPLSATAESIAQPQIGKRLTVHIRRDYLGQAADYPADPLAEKHLSQNVTITGLLEHINSDWVVLKLNTGLHWIARDSVLLIAGDQ
jgi:hypothetical protein